MDQNSDLDWISAKYTLKLVNQAVPQPSSHFSPITKRPKAAQLTRVMNTSSICTYIVSTHYLNTVFLRNGKFVWKFFFFKFNSSIMFLHQMENSLFLSFSTFFSWCTTLRNLCISPLKRLFGKHAYSYIFSPIIIIIIIIIIYWYRE